MLRIVLLWLSLLLVGQPLTAQEPSPGAADSQATMHSNPLKGPAAADSVRVQAGWYADLPQAAPARYALQMQEPGGRTGHVSTLIVAGGAAGCLFAGYHGAKKLGPLGALLGCMGVFVIVGSVASLADLLDLRRAIPDPPRNLGARPAGGETPAYKVLDTVDMVTGGRHGEVLITSFSRQTPVAERESTLRAIMAKENFSRADLYCSEGAKKANSSSSYAAAHPNALKTCFLGSIQDGAFTPGEALF